MQHAGLLLNGLAKPLLAPCILFLLIKPRPTANSEATDTIEKMQFLCSTSARRHVLLHLATV